MAKKEAILDATETVIDTAEEVAEVVENVKPGSFNLNGTTKNQQLAVIVVTAVVSAGVAGGLTYYFTKKHLKAKYEKVIDEELKEAKIFYKRLHKTDEYESPEELAKKYDEDGPDEKDVQEAVEALQTYQGVEVKQGDRYSPSVVEKPAPTEEALVEETTVEVKKTRNVFSEAKVDEEDPDLEEELRSRDLSKPHLITFDEFFENEHEYTELNLTYYEEDDVLADERDQHINETDELVGNANLLKFGLGSKDKNVVYIRNHQKEIIAEICLSKGSYVKEVLGFIEHSADSGRIRRFRHGDDG